MSPFVAVFIFSVIIGAFLIIMAYVVSLSANKPAASDDLNESLSLIEERLAKSVEDADAALEQLTNMSSIIFEELEGKYKELLFLYQLIDEKKLETSNIYSKNMELIDSFKDSLVDMNLIDSFKNISSADVSEVVTEDKSSKELIDISDDSKHSVKFSSHPRYAEIISLFNDGKSVSDIAKSLNIGQGEVKLILELNKVR